MESMQKELSLNANLLHSHKPAANLRAKYSSFASSPFNAIPSAVQSTFPRILGNVLSLCQECAFVGPYDSTAPKNVLLLDYLTLCFQRNTTAECANNVLLARSGLYIC